MDVAAVYLQVIRNVVDGVRVSDMHGQCFFVFPKGSKLKRMSFSSSPLPQADFSTEQLDETALRTLATVRRFALR